MTTVIEATSDTATELIASTPGIALVDFTAGWCAPCRVLAPILEQLAAETDDLTVLTVDVDAFPEFAQRHLAMSFPTLLFFVAGQPVHRLVGTRGLGALREELGRVRDLVPAES